MLHQGILPFHRRWATFLMRLELIVVDELHSLRGIFGSNVAHVLRRLRRVCAHYGSQPTFCFAQRDDRQPGRARVAALRADVSRDRRRRLTAVRALLRALAAAAARRAHRARVVRQRRDRRAARALRRATVARRSRSPGVGAAPSSSRATPRRMLETRATAARPRASRRTAPATSPRSGASSNGSSATASSLGVAATNALELGIDVGGLDAVVLNGFPGTLASMRQQAGRAGRTEPPRPRPCSSPATTSSTSGTPRTRPSCSRGRPRPRSSTRRTRSCSGPTSRARRTSCRSRPSDERWFGPGLDDAVRELVLDGAAQAARREDVLGRA